MKTPHGRGAYRAVAMRALAPAVGAIALALAVGPAAGSTAANTAAEQGRVAPVAQNVSITPLIRRQLRAAYLRSGGRYLRRPETLRLFPPRERRLIRQGRVGPISGSGVPTPRVARIGRTEWAVATFRALADQPEVFRRRVGQRRWRDLGDTGGLYHCPPRDAISRPPLVALKAMGLLGATSLCPTRAAPPPAGRVHFGTTSAVHRDDASDVVVRSWIYSPPPSRGCLVPVRVQLNEQAPQNGPLVAELSTALDVCEGGREPWPGWLGRQLVVALPALESTPRLGYVVTIDAGRGRHADRLVREVV